MPIAMTESDHSNPGRRQLKFRWLPGPFAIVRLAPDAALPKWATEGEFTSVTRSTEELSVVCHADNLPAEELVGKIGTWLAILREESA